MEPDELQQAWRSQNPQQVTIDIDALLNLVKRNNREFRSAILWRDVMEIGVALAMTVFFAIVGGSWPWLVLAASCLFVAIFMLIDRRRQRRQLPESSATLAMWLERSRVDVEHQVWLLKNVFWWYLLPPLIGISCVFGRDIWKALHNRSIVPLSVVVPSAVLAFACAVFYGVYLLNQHAVKRVLRPRLEELDALTQGLTCDEE